MKVVVSPSTFNTLIRGAHEQSHCGADDGGEGACIYEEGYVSGAVVPFSWEEKPGVPLNIVSSKYSTTIEVIRGKRVSELGSQYREQLLLLNPNIHMDIKRSVCESKEEQALVLAPSKHSTNHMLFRNDEEKALALSPLNQYTSTNQMLFPLPPPPNSLLQMATTNVGAFSSTTFDHSKPSTPLPRFNSSTNLYTHMKKHRASSFPPCLNINKSTSSSSNSCVGKANYELKDDPFLRAIQACTQTSKVSNNNPRECDYADIKKSNYIVGSTKNSSAKNSSTTTIKSKSTNNYIGSITESGLHSKLYYSSDYITAKNSSTTTKTNNYIGSITESGLHSKLYNSSGYIVAMAKDAGNSAAAAKSEAAMKGLAEDASNSIRIRGRSCGAMKAPLISRALMIEKEGSCSYDNGGMKAKLQYESHPAFMVASFQQQQSAKQKKAVTSSIKDGAHHRSSSSSSSYGWLSCRSADNHDSIVRIHNRPARSSFS